MSDNSQSKPVDKVLLAAWRRLFYYDRISYHEKRKFVNLRKIVIGISLTATLASVTVLLFGELEVIVRNAVAFLSISLPIIALGVMQFINRYAAPTTWIQYRYAAEKLRSNIYLYRAGAGEYNIELHKRDDILAQRVKESITLISQTVPQPLRNKRERGGNSFEKVSLDVSLEEANKEIIEALQTSQEDDGFRLLDLKEYTQFRLHDQLAWYIKRVSKAYRITQRYSIYTITITTVGSIIGVLLASQPDQIRWVGLVAIANALSVALNNWGNMQMFGDTYQIFDDTIRKLKDHDMTWQGLSNNPDISGNTEILTQAKLRFIEETEQILMHELQTWCDVATEIQMANDQLMMKNIRETQASNPLVDVTRIRLMFSQLNPETQAQLLGYLQDDNNKPSSTDLLGA
jgi:hypothetical protein